MVSAEVKGRREGVEGLFEAVVDQGKRRQAGLLSGIDAICMGVAPN